MEEKKILILLLDHSKEGLEKLVHPLEKEGFETVISDSLEKTISLSRERIRPSLIIYSPLVFNGKGIEMELLGKFIKNEPVPVLLVVDNLDKLERATSLPLMLRDFVTSPVDYKEVIHRISVGLQIRKEFQTLKKETERLSGLIIRDFKTGLFNARHLHEELKREFQRVHRTNKPLSLLLIDIDDFKRINDTTEYAFGDLVLKEFANTLLANIREVDVAARFGGDEFMVLLPGTTPGEAIQVASRIKRVVSRITISDGRYTKRITVSIGVDCYNGKSISTPEELKSRANRALQEAKRKGKNCIWLYAEPLGESV